MMKIIVLFIILTIAGPSGAQPHRVQVNIKNQPFNSVVIGYVKGDRFIFLDTLETRNILTPAGPLKTVVWNFPTDSQAGIYRMELGRTTYARVMDEPAQQFEFIFNREDIHIETDFKFPVDSLKVLQSEENKVWFAFLKQEQEFRRKLGDLEMETDIFHLKVAEAKEEDSALKINYKEAETSLFNSANGFNHLQMQRDMFIMEVTQEQENLFAARLLHLFREPFRDGFLNPEERRISYRKEYLKYLNFTDELLVYSPVFCDKLFRYLVTYNQRGFNQEQRENEYIKAVDAIMQALESEVGQGGTVYEFVLNYLVTGFEGLKMDRVLSWIAENYAEPLCTTEEKTTLLRKLEAQKMTIGSVVPDFTMNNLDGIPIVFSEVLKNRNLVIFWASWCPHCNSMLPAIKSLFYGKDNIEIIAVALDESGTDWRKAVLNAGFEGFRNLSDLRKWDSPVAGDYNIYATPTMFLIDSQRRILAKPSTLEELSKVINK